MSSRKPQHAIVTRKSDVEPQVKIHRKLDLRLIELINKRDRGVRSVTSDHINKKTNRSSGRENFFNEFF